MTPAEWKCRHFVVGPLLLHEQAPKAKSKKKDDAGLF
jgi:hypothetical protein